MGLIRRRKDGRDKTAETHETSSQESPDVELQEQAQVVMKDNLELMRDVVMRIREDPDFAKGIYNDCPRLQHLLKKYPDLRPVFEDPKLVRINFEAVYREAGGVLPEDKVKKPSLLVRFVKSPVFKLLKILFLIKKVMAFVVGGGFGLLAGFFTSCCFEEPPVDELDMEDAGNAEMDPQKEALNKAADHLEDPEVQEQMQQLLSDPDGLEEAIQNDEELRALRESNPLCEELMSDPETMRLITDPDNLRALGECPQLIEADFIDPEGFTPDDFGESGGDVVADLGAPIESAGAGEVVGDTYGEFEMEVEGDYEDEFDGEEGDDWFADGELEEPDADPDNQQGGSRGKQQQRRQQTQNRGGGGGGFAASIGLAATEMVASHFIGEVFGDTLMLGGGDGGGGDIGDIGDVGDDVGDGLDSGVADAGDAAEDATDGVDNDKKNKAAGAGAANTGGADALAAGAGAGAAGGAAACVATSQRSDVEGQGKEDKDESNDEEKPKGRFFSAANKVKNMVSVVSTAAKEHVATSILGDDWGEALVERQEEGKEKKEGENDTKEEE